MGAETKIEWCDHTFNPWWGCSRVSPGCEHCYAEAFDRRLGGAHWGLGRGRRLFGAKHWSEPMRWNAAAVRDGARRRVFCASMADVFEDAPKLEDERQWWLWPLIRETTHLDWLLLSKRPENFARFLPADWGHGWANVWLGVTAEDQRRADERIPILSATPARIRFVSAEPLLERINLAPCPGIDWLIIGGESGAGARQFDPAWARDLIERCSMCDMFVFVKQLGARPMFMRLNDPKGGDWSEWPPDLRVREFPERATVR